MRHFFSKRSSRRNWNLKIDEMAAKWVILFEIRPVFSRATCWQYFVLFFCGQLWFLVLNWTLPLFLSKANRATYLCVSKFHGWIIVMEMTWNAMHSQLKVLIALRANRCRRFALFRNHCVSYAKQRTSITMLERGQWSSEIRSRHNWWLRWWEIDENAK